jgi:hypothetical protein
MLVADRSPKPLQTPVTNPPPTFWQEFFRVYTDKLILLGLIVFLYFVHQEEQMKYVIGALAVLIQGQRWGRSSG